MATSQYESPDWPASTEHLAAARNFLSSIATKPDDRPILILPDRDVDGLTSGGIIHRLITRILLKNRKIGVPVHFISKGAWIGDTSERSEIDAINPSHIVILDQGSRGSPPLVSNAEVLIIDHHVASQFPQDAIICSACNHLPVATTSLLTFVVVEPFLKDADPDTRAECEWLAVLGVKGDLGDWKWDSPFPAALHDKVNKLYTKKALSEAVSLLNTPRRTAECPMSIAWTAIESAKRPQEVATSKGLHAARALIAQKVEQHTHTPPKFSKDGRFALLTISSPDQIHPVIATRWAGHLKSTKLEAVGVANTSFLPGKVNFSVRLARRNPAAQSTNLIELLKEYAGKTESLREQLLEREDVGFARGHREASGGSLSPETWEEFVRDGLEILERPVAGDAARKRKEAEKPKNTLDRFFTPSLKKGKSTE